MHNTGKAPYSNEVDPARLAKPANKIDEALAHVRQDGNGEWLTHRLDEHLQAVAKLAAEYAAPFNSSDWSAIAGLWHDLGKYKPAFQNYIGKASGYKVDAHIEMSGKAEREHSTAGAIHAIRRHPGIGRLIAYLIAGHHSGLPDWFKAEAKGRGLEDRIKDDAHLEDALLGNIPDEILHAPLPSTLPTVRGEHAHLWIRILFSCLVDADFLDTEIFMDPEKANLRFFMQDLIILNNKLHTWMQDRDAELRLKGLLDTNVNVVRREVLQDALNSAKQTPGFFSMTVPTGGGKTLSSMAFALAHAIHNKKFSRVIIAIPYTSIIEQTAKQYREIFGKEAVLEHHSNLDISHETPQSRLSSENWDAKIIVTTNVQLLESLFAARTSRCRKLHNIVNSVIILDEAQMLPPEKLMPTISVLKSLVGDFGCTIVLCTATQPALIGYFDSDVEGMWEGLQHRGTGPGQHIKGVLEIVRDPLRLSRKLHRVKLSLHEKKNVDWLDMAKELAAYDRVLCIVNRRQDCRELYEALRSQTKEEVVHLSALMCGEHRSKIIEEIKEKLDYDMPLRVVSTQLVEAGVDIDFPVVYRAMAGLDSIAQAAGRCNREGKLNVHGKLGQVVIFNPLKSAPPGILRKGEDACKEILNIIPDECLSLSPRAFEKYFQVFFKSLVGHGKREYEHYLTTNSGVCHFQFRSAADWYQLIDDKGYKSVIVWYKRNISRKSIDNQKLIDEFEYFGPNRERLRRLSRYTVNIPVWAHENLRAQGMIRELESPYGKTDIWVQAVDALYDDIFGLRIEGPQYESKDFVC